MLKDKFVQRTRQKFVGHKIGMNLQMNALVMIVMVMLKDAFAYKVAMEQRTRHMFVGQKNGINLQMNALAINVMLIKKDTFAYKVAMEQRTRHIFVGHKIGMNLHHHAARHFTNAYTMMHKLVIMASHGARRRFSIL